MKPHVITSIAFSLLFLLSLLLDKPALAVFNALMGLAFAMLWQFGGEKVRGMFSRLF